MGVYERKLPKMATWAPMDTATSSTTGKRLSAQRLWLVLCLAMLSTFSADARIISGRGYSDTIVFSSNAGAAEYVGNQLGRVCEGGRVQRPTFLQTEGHRRRREYFSFQRGRYLGGWSKLGRANWSAGERSRY